MRIAQAVDPEHSSTFCDIKRSVFISGSKGNAHLSSVLFNSICEDTVFDHLRSLKDKLKSVAINYCLRLIPLTE